MRELAIEKKGSMYILPDIDQNAEKDAEKNF